jgi:hypothetical protein
MNRRRLLLVGFASTAAALGIGVCLLWPRDRPGITRANRERIREGMTLAEVEAILGGPERDATQRLGMGLTMRCWEADDLLLDVVFDQQDRVVMVPTEWGDLAHKSFLATFRRRFGI